MSVAIPLNIFNHHDVYFHKPVHNNIINNSKFIRTIYSNGLVSMNNICLEVPFKFEHSNRNRFFFDMQKNHCAILFLLQMEENILNRIGISGKMPSRKLAQQLQAGYLKIFTCIDDPETFLPILLKISGIWESESEYGVTFKFVFGLPVGHKVGHDGVHDGNKYKIQHR